MYICLYVLYATPHRRIAYRASNFQIFTYGPCSGRFSFILFLIHPAITVSSNNSITLCSYCVQLFTTLRTIVDNVIRVFFDCSK